MASIKFEFNLPEDHDAFVLAYHGGSMHTVLWNFHEWLFNEYDEVEHTEEEISLLKKCLDQLSDEMELHGIRLDMVS